MFVIFSLFNSAARTLCFLFFTDVADRADPAPAVFNIDSTFLEFTLREDAARDTVGTRFCCVDGTIFTFVVSRGFTFCCVVAVRETTRCCGFAAVLAFLDAFCVLSARFVVVVARPTD